MSFRGPARNLKRPSPQPPPHPRNPHLPSFLRPLPSFLRRQEPRHIHTPLIPFTTRRTHNGPLPRSGGAARAEPVEVRAGGEARAPPTHRSYYPQPNPPKNPPAKLLTPLCFVLSLHRSNNNLPNKEGGTKHQGKPPRPDRENSTPRPTPKALAQARGSSRRRHSSPRSRLPSPTPSGDGRSIWTLYGAPSLKDMPSMRRPQEPHLCRRLKTRRI